MTTYRIIEDCVGGDSTNGAGYAYTAGELVTPTTSGEIVQLNCMIDYGLAIIVEGV